MSSVLAVPSSATRQIESEEHTSELQSHDNLVCRLLEFRRVLDRKSTRLNSSHTIISYAVFCLKKTVSEQRAGMRDLAVQAAPLAAEPGGGRARRTRGGWFGRAAAGGRAGGVNFFFFLMIRRPPRSTLFP